MILSEKSCGQHATMPAKIQGRANWNVTVTPCKRQPKRIGTKGTTLARKITLSIGLALRALDRLVAAGNSGTPMVSRFATLPSADGRLDLTASAGRFLA
jgi:hypothetical protein